MVYLLFVLGFILLIKGADALVEGASAIARGMGVSDLIVGLTIISIGTSIPELFVNVLSSLNGTPAIATGNVLGSNIANVLLILGCTALIKPLPVQRQTIVSELPFSIAAALLLGFLANSVLAYEQGDELFLSRGDGIIILVFFLLFATYIVMVAKEEPLEGTAKPTEEIKVNRNRELGKILAGIVGLFLGGTWVVSGAIAIAQYFGMSEAFIGLTIVAIGTSLPELVTSMRAAMKGNTDIAVGNVVGSNIFNILWILGLSATITPLPFDVASNADIMMVVGASCLLLFAMIVGKRMVIRRWEGVVFLLTYLAYLSFLLSRG